LVAQRCVLGFAEHSQRPTVEANSTFEQIVRQTAKSPQLGRRNLLDVSTRLLPLAEQVEDPHKNDRKDHRSDADGA
jgi:hypothetical protein